MDDLRRIVQLFHNASLDSNLEEKKKVNKKHLLNLLNYINFQGGTILINFRHPKYDTIISFQAKPQPCLENSLDCLWTEPAGFKQKLNSYKFLNFLLTDGLKLILVKADLKGISEERISFTLPEICYELGHRKVRRHSCKGIQVDFIQNSVIFCGFLQNFSAVSFCIEVSAVPPQSFCWVNPEHAVYIIFKNRQDILYSGECKIIRQTCDQTIRTFVLEPVNNQMPRFKPKEFRSVRHKLSPSPNIIFVHPLTQKMINLEVEDLSGSGFLVEEYLDSSVLLPGLIISELHIEFAHDFKIKCKVQIVNRNVCKVEDEKTYVKCGITILDMDIQEQVRLSGLLHQVANKKSYVCNRVDTNALWKFFFETGFIYPKKYALMHTDKEKFKETYEKLYVQNPHIARHFVYQDKGTIQGHISIVRFYENTWLIHHHAASRSGYSKSGLVVLKQVERYINDFHRLYSTRMNFVSCYFRPDNKFPNRVFGGCAREINKSKECSIDSFAYFPFPKTCEQWNLPETMVLIKTQPDDLLELESFYEYESGGLMLHALDLEPSIIDCDTLSKEYQQLGFKRERYLFSLKKDDSLKAVIMVNISNIGLNMSNLTNCIHVIILDTKDVSCNTLYASLSMLSKYYEQENIPILLYPVSYAQNQSITYEKIHTLWILNTQYTDHYFKYMDNLFNHNHSEEI
ncbi:MAG: PilZ domain-containing protein [Planctomycetes bacterium]|nr:PilZ domain-containing protein [Planctomycetota bacterium]